MARKVEQKKPLYKYWFYTGDDDEAMFEAIRAQAVKCLGIGWFTVAFVKIQTLFRQRGYGRCSMEQISGKAMRYVRRQPGDMPYMLDQFQHVYENNRNGLLSLISVPDQDFATRVLNTLMYCGARRTDDVIVVNTTALDWRICTRSLDKDDAAYFAAMTASLIACEEKPDEVRAALWCFEKAMGAEKKHVQEERERLVKEIQDKQRRLRELGGEMPKED